MGARQPHDLRIETALRARHDHQMRLVLAGAREKTRRSGVADHAGAEIGKNPFHALRIGTSSLGCFRRAAKFRRCDQLHRFRDLACRFDARDPKLEFLEARHNRSDPCLSS